MNFTIIIVFHFHQQLYMVKGIEYLMEKKKTERKKLLFESHKGRRIVRSHFKYFNLVYGFLLTTKIKVDIG